MILVYFHISGFSNTACRILNVLNTNFETGSNYVLYMLMLKVFHI